MYIFMELVKMWFLYFYYNDCMLLSLYQKFTLQWKK